MGVRVPSAAHYTCCFYVLVDCKFLVLVALRCFIPELFLCLLINEVLLNYLVLPMNI